MSRALGQGLAPLGPLIPALSPYLGLLGPPQHCPDRAEGNRGVLWGAGGQEGSPWEMEKGSRGTRAGGRGRRVHAPPPSGVPRLPSASPPKPSSASPLPAASPSLAGCCTPQVPLRVPKPGQVSPSPLGPSPALPPNIPLPSVLARGLALLPAGTGWAGGLLRTLISPLRPPSLPGNLPQPRLSAAWPGWG